MTIQCLKKQLNLDHRFCVFTVLKLISENAVTLDLSGDMIVHPVTHMSPTSQYFQQPERIMPAVVKRLVSIHTIEGS